MNPNHKEHDKNIQLSPELIQAGFEIRDGLGSLTDKVDGLYKAFPSGDVDAHCRYHQFLIDEQAEMKRLVAAVKEKFIITLLWSLFITLVLACWEWMKVKIRMIAS